MSHFERRRSSLLKVVVAGSLLALCSGCKSDDKAKSTAASASASAARAIPSASASAVSDPALALYPDADIVVPEDFAKDAEKEISADNYKQKRDEIAEELGRKAASDGAQGGL